MKPSISQYGSVNQRLKPLLVRQSPPTRTNIRQELNLIEPYCNISRLTSNRVVDINFHVGGASRNENRTWGWFLKIKLLQSAFFRQVSGQIGIAIVYSSSAIPGLSTSSDVINRSYTHLFRRETRTGVESINHATYFRTNLDPVR
jgi:hypothetical protein